MMDELCGGGTVTTYTYSLDSDRRLPSRFEHDPTDRVFRVPGTPYVIVDERSWVY